MQFTKHYKSQKHLLLYFLVLGCLQVCGQTVTGFSASESMKLKSAIPNCSSTLFGELYANGGDFRLPGGDIVILFKNDKVKKKVKTKYNGSYQTEIPGGVYSVTVQIPGHPVYRRANIRVKCGSKLMVNIHVYVGIFSHSGDVPRPTVHFFSPLEDWSHDERLDPVIAFTSKEESVYENAVFTLNQFTIVADKLRVDWKSRVITAEGAILFEDGDTRLLYSKLTIKFATSRLSISSVRFVQNN